MSKRRRTETYEKPGAPGQFSNDSCIPFIVELKKKLGGLQGKRILDYGCGKWNITQMLEQFYGANVAGIDASPEVIQQAQAADPNGEYRLMKTNRFPFSNTSFDAVMSNWFWSSINSPETIKVAAAESYRVLKAGAPLVVLVKNPTYTRAPTNTYLKGEPNMKYCQVIDYKNAFLEAGFKQVRVYVPRSDHMIEAEIKFMQDKGAPSQVGYQNLVNDKLIMILTGLK